MPFSPQFPEVVSNFPSKKKLNESREYERNHVRMASVADLPPEILLQIFEYLPLRDVLCMKDVCRNWKPLIKYKSLYRAISVNVDVKLDLLLKILSTYDNVIQTVTLSNRKDTNLILKSLAGCPNLRRLKIKNCSGTKSKCVSTAMLIRVFKQTKLSDFAMKHCTCFVHVLSILPPEPCTRKMVGFSSNGTDSATQRMHFLGPHFFAMLRTSSDSLTYLSIVDANINFLMTDFNTLFRLIGNCRKLRELSYHVCYLPITDENFREIYNLKCLTSLCLKSLRSVSEKVFENFFEVDRTGAIKKLELYDLHTLDELTIERIGTGCPNLENLTLCQQEKGKELLTREALIMLPRWCPKLQILRLSYLPEEVINVVELLSKQLSSLKHLEFQINSRGEWPMKLKSCVSNLMPTFDVKTSRFGRISCQLKRQYLIKSGFCG